MKASSIIQLLEWDCFLISNYLGHNAIYKLIPVIAGIRDLEPKLGDHEFLGHGKITVSDMHVKTP